MSRRRIEEALSIHRCNGAYFLALTANENETEYLGPYELMNAAGSLVVAKQVGRKMCEEVGWTPIRYRRINNGWALDVWAEDVEYDDEN